MPALSEVVNGDSAFQDRDIGPYHTGEARMLDVLGYPSVDASIDSAAPTQIRSTDGLRLPAARPEQQVLR